MPLKRLLLILAFGLLLYLTIYSWNQRTHFLDKAVTNTGLEASGLVIKSVLFVQDCVSETWKKYIDLISVHEENELLKKQLSEAKINLFLNNEDYAELIRLRKILTLSPPKEWEMQGARVLAGRMGSNAVLATIIIDHGYITGAIPGTPVMTQEGIIGRVFRSGPTTATILLLTDPVSRIAVVSQKNRVQGIIVGSGTTTPLEMQFVSNNSSVMPGEILVTSGLDEAFPKGIPVAKVVKIKTSDLSPFQSIQAVPLANTSNIEELVLLNPLKPIIENIPQNQHTELERKKHEPL